MSQAPYAWVNKIPLLSRVVTRFELNREKLRQEAIPLVGMVLVASSVDDLLRTSRAQRTTAIDTSAGGTKIAHTVPAGKRWLLKHWYIQRTAGALASVQAMLSISGNACYMAASGTSLVYQSLNITLNAGDTLNLVVATAEASSFFESNIAVDEEDAY